MYDGYMVSHNECWPSAGSMLLNGYIVLKLESSWGQSGPALNQPSFDIACFVGHQVHPAPTGIYRIYKYISN